MNNSRFNIILKSIIIVMVLFIFSACGERRADSNNAAKNSGVELKYSELLNIQKEDGYTKVEVRSDKTSEQPLATYILVDRGASHDNLPKGEVIDVPLQNAVVYTSVHAALLKELGSVGVIKGVTDASYFKIPEVLEGIANSTIIDLGNPSSPSVEKIIDLDPDAIIISIYEGMTVQDLSSQGITYLKFTDNLESTPLGRAEWIKFMGLLTGHEAEANEIFASVETKYNDLVAKVKDNSSKPKVLVENMYEGVWYLPAGGSYMAHLLEDAGAIYPWATTDATGSLALTFEEVLEKASNADYWVIKSFGPLTKESLLKQDKRYGEFAPLNHDAVYYSDTSASMLFEEFPYHPDLLLADYMHIFHPDIKDGYQLRYFQQLK
jgi:iron complex transport system substrate-binding protein